MPGEEEVKRDALRTVGKPSRLAPGKGLCLLQVQETIRYIEQDTNLSTFQEEYLGIADLGIAVPDHTVPYATVLSRDAFQALRARLRSCCPSGTRFRHLATASNQNVSKAAVEPELSFLAPFRISGNHCPRITPSLHHSITPSLHHSITPSLRFSGDCGDPL